MARYKHLAKKLRLINREKSNNPAPAWVRIRTRMKVRRVFRLRHWRRSKLNDI